MAVTIDWHRCVLLQQIEIAVYHAFLSLQVDTALEDRRKILFAAVWWACGAQVSRSHHFQWYVKLTYL